MINQKTLCKAWVICGVVALVFLITSFVATGALIHLLFGVGFALGLIASGCLIARLLMAAKEEAKYEEAEEIAKEEWKKKVTEDLELIKKKLAEIEKKVEEK